MDEGKNENKAEQREFDSAIMVPFELENVEDKDEATTTYVYADGAQKAWCTGLSPHICAFCYLEAYLFICATVFGGWAIQFAAVGVVRLFRY